MTIRRADVSVRDSTERLNADVLSRYIREVDERLLLSYGNPTPFSYGDYQARIGDLIRLDPGEGELSVTLPLFATEDEGKAITIANISDNEDAVTVRSQSGAVNGEDSVVIAKPYFVRQAVAVRADTQLWLLTVISDGGTAPSAGEQPIWEWNGTDLTQFDAVVDAQGATTTASVVSAYGGNWIQLAINTWQSYGNPWRCQSVLPITEVFATPDYRIEAEARILTGATGTSWLGPQLLVRWDSTGAGTYPGDGHMIRLSPSDSSPSSAGRYIVHYDNSGTGTAIRTERVNQPWTTAIGDVVPMSLSMTGSSVITGSMDGMTMGRVYATSVTTALQAGLGINNFGCNAHSIQYQNIKVWAI